jgi:hypothetical protein
MQEHIRCAFNHSATSFALEPAQHTQEWLKIKRTHSQK